MKEKEKLKKTEENQHKLDLLICHLSIAQFSFFLSELGSAVLTTEDLNKEALENELREDIDVFCDMLTVSECTCRPTIEE